MSENEPETVNDEAAVEANDETGAEATAEEAPLPFEESDETGGDDESTDTGDPNADPAPAEDDSEVATPGGEGR